MPDGRSAKLLGCPSWRGSATLMVPFYGLTRPKSISGLYGFFYTKVSKLE